MCASLISCFIFVSLALVCHTTYLIQIFKHLFEDSYLSVLVSVCARIFSSFSSFLALTTDSHMTFCVNVCMYSVSI
jgi:hypothetical protein